MGPALVGFQGCSYLSSLDPLVGFNSIRSRTSYLKLRRVSIIAETAAQVMPSLRSRYQWYREEGSNPSNDPAVRAVQALDPLGSRGRFQHQKVRIEGVVEGSTGWFQWRHDERQINVFFRSRWINRKVSTGEIRTVMGFTRHLGIRRSPRMVPITVSRARGFS